MAEASEHYGLALGVVTDDVVEPEHHNRVAGTLDRVVGKVLTRMMAAGAYAGWELGLDGQVSAGEGLVAGCWCSTAVAQVVTGWTNGATNYVFARAEAEAPVDGSVVFFSQVSATKPAGAILLASAEVDAQGAVTAVGNQVAEADRNCVRLEIGGAGGSGLIAGLLPAQEFEVEITHAVDFLVPGTIAFLSPSEDVAWELAETWRGDGFVVRGTNNAAEPVDFAYAWSRRGFVV